MANKYCFLNNNNKNSLFVFHDIAYKPIRSPPGYFFAIVNKGLKSLWLISYSYQQNHFARTFRFCQKNFAIFVITKK